MRRAVATALAPRVGLERGSDTAAGTATTGGDPRGAAHSDRGWRTYVIDAPDVNVRR